MIHDKRKHNEKKKGQKYAGQEKLKQNIVAYTELSVNDRLSSVWASDESD